jgi:hypothetical protein
MPGSQVQKHRADCPIPVAAKQLRRGLIGESRQIRCAKDYH